MREPKLEPNVGRPCGKTNGANCPQSKARCADQPGHQRDTRSVFAGIQKKLGKNLMAWRAGDRTSVQRLRSAAAVQGQQQEIADCKFKHRSAWPVPTQRTFSEHLILSTPSSQFADGKTSLIQSHTPTPNANEPNELHIPKTQRRLQLGDDGGERSKHLLSSPLSSRKVPPLRCSFHRGCGVEMLVRNGCLGANDDDNDNDKDNDTPGEDPERQPETWPYGLE